MPKIIEELKDYKIYYGDKLFYFDNKIKDSSKKALKKYSKLSDDVENFIKSNLKLPGIYFADNHSFFISKDTTIVTEFRKFNDSTDKKLWAWALRIFVLTKNSSLLRKLLNHLEKKKIKICSTDY